MDPDRWRRIEEIYQSAAERKPEDREAYLAAACGEDEELRREVESLLAQQSVDTPLDQPAWDMAAGGRLGPYELLAPIGHGGMGAVFKARDTRLNRNVAIKVSTAQFSGRFANEAQSVAALNHPNVCTLYDVGPNYLVMELVEGADLAGPVPIETAIGYARQIAAGLEAAHEKGIIHRDLKPANIKITPDGTVKILDFGLAKAAVPASPTPALTESGMILGTAAYMSPEQARGEHVDKRADIWAFGVVFYELLTGKKLFGDGKGVSDAIAAVLTREPDFTALPKGTPPRVRRLIEHCLRKDPKQRLHDIGDARILLDELEPEALAPPAPPAPQRRWIWVGAVTAVLLLSASVAIWRLQDKASPDELRAEVLTSYPGGESRPSLSPDGTKVAFAWTGEKQSNFAIYVKQIGAPGAPLRITNNPAMENAPAWSPDDRWIAFLRCEQGKTAIMLVSPLGGQERKLVDIVENRHASGSNLVFSSVSWTPDGKWLVYPNADSPAGPLSVWAISVETGERRRLTTFLAQSAGGDLRLGDWFPSISPDGRTLAFARLVGHGIAELYALRLTRDLRPEDQPTRIIDEHYPYIGQIAWTADGAEIVYGAGGEGSLSLWRVPISGKRAPRRLPFALPSAHSPSISRTQSRLVYVWRLSNMNLWQMDISTKKRRMLISSTYVHQVPQYSPNGRRIAFASNQSGSWQIWTCGAGGANCQQVTSGEPSCMTPRWSPDGQWLAYECNSKGQPEICVIASDGGPPRRMTDHPLNDVIPSWSRDGRWIYFTSDRGGSYELWKVPKDGGEAIRVTHSGGFAAFESADGRHIYHTKWALSGASGLFRVPVEGGEETLVLPEVENHMFAVTSKGIYYLDAQKVSIHFFDPATRRATPLGVWQYFTISPDDRTVVWQQRDRLTQDLMLVEGFR